MSASSLFVDVGFDWVIFNFYLCLCHLYLWMLVFFFRFRFHWVTFISVLALTESSLAAAESSLAAGFHQALFQLLWLLGSSYFLRD